MNGIVTNWINITAFCNFPAFQGVLIFHMFYFYLAPCSLVGQFSPLNFSVEGTPTSLRCTRFGRGHFCSGILQHIEGTKGF